MPPLDIRIVVARRRHSAAGGTGLGFAEALALVRRAVDQRAAVEADSTLRSYRTRAHGFVFFLAQIGEGLTEPPAVVKADELDVEVYWQAPNRSKQGVLGWRDGAFLPTDIEYHRDHLGIVTNNFRRSDPDRRGRRSARCHPTRSPARGRPPYQYALGRFAGGSASGGGEDHRAGGAGTAPLLRAAAGGRHASTSTRPPAELVRFRFSFTPAGLPRPAARGYHHRPGERTIRGPLVASDPPGDRDPAARQLTSTSPPGASSAAGGRSPTTTSTSRSRPRVLAGPAHRRPHGPAPRRSDLGRATVPRRSPTCAVPVDRQDMDALRVEVERIAGSAGARRSSRQPSRYRLAE